MKAASAGRGRLLGLGDSCGPKGRPATTSKLNATFLYSRSAAAQSKSISTGRRVRSRSNARSSGIETFQGRCAVASGDFSELGRVLVSSSFRADSQSWYNSLGFIDRQSGWAVQSR